MRAADSFSTADAARPIDDEAEASSRRPPPVARNAVVGVDAVG
jgi:hypothetical protein